MFTNVAAKYDLMNDAMSGGMHRLWKDRFVRRVKPRASDQILDMAGGTGDIAFRLAESGASITVADINPAMLEVGMKRAAERGFDDWSGPRRMPSPSPSPTNSSTPIRSRSAFGTSPTFRRHCVRRTGPAARRAVLLPGILDHRVAGFSDVYDAYSHKLVPKLGQMLAGDADSYRYLIESIRRFPDMPTLKA